jgi:DNA-binding NtrC family response regulator
MGKVAKDLVTGEGNILIMDDEEIIRDSMGEILTFLGYQVESSKNGEEAIEKYIRAKDSTKPFDLVILDLNIQSGMGGKDTIKELLTIDPKAKVLVSSGNSNDPVMIEYQKYGFSGIVDKPFDIKELSETLHRLIEEIDE